MTTIVATYTIQIGRYADEILLLDADQLNAWINETEENLTDLLPEGYSAKISRWDEPDFDPDATPFHAPATQDHEGGIFGVKTYPGDER